MRKLKLTKIIASSLVIASVLALNPIGANAQWQQDNTGWWYTEGSTWSVGWRLVDEKWYYFGQDGYMKTDWIKYDGKSYYLNSDGSMAHDTTIDGLTVGSDGAWNQYAGTGSLTVLSNINPNATTISDVTGVKFDGITKIVFYDGKGGRNKPVKVYDKQKIKEFMGYLDGYSIKKTEDPKGTGWIDSAVFYMNDEHVMSITFVNPIIINRDYFNITKGDLDHETIGKFLKSIEPSYDIMAGL